jgi:hypothetical protein
MKALRTNTCVVFCFCLFPVSLFSQERVEHDRSESCREFVAKFYSWYLAEGTKRNRLPDSDSVLASRPYLFSSVLVRQLREDSEAQKKAGSDLVSIEADPFLGADGLAERYAVEKITIADGRCWAEVHGVWGAKENAGPDVTPELVEKSGRWLFVNFYFPSPSDPKAWNLRGELKAGRTFRRQYGPGSNKKP